MDLHGLGARDLFFQCVYAHPVVTESIAAVNRLACDVFERPGNGCGYEGDYMPHLSLVYGDLDQKTKAKAMEELAKTVRKASCRPGLQETCRKKRPAQKCASSPQRT